MLDGWQVGLGGAGPYHGTLRALHLNMPPHCPSPVIAHRCGPFVAFYWALRHGEFGGVRLSTLGKKSVKKNAISQYATLISDHSFERDGDTISVGAELTPISVKIARAWKSKKAL